MDARLLLSLYSVYGAMSDDQGVMVSSSTSNLCLDSGNYGSSINVWECVPTSSTQKWILTDGRCLKHVATGLCATSSGQQGSKVFLNSCGPPCHKAAVGNDKTIEFDQSGLCFDHGSYGNLVNLWTCEPTSSTQQWKMDYTPKCKDGSTRVRNGDNVGCQKVIGSWVFVQGSTGPMKEQSVSIAEGFSKSTGWSWTSSEEFSHSMTTSVGAGFEVEGIGASMSVDQTTGEKIARSDSESWSTEYHKEITRTFTYPGGAIWRWQWQVTSTFGDSTIKTFNLALTGQNAPCCLPGMFKNPAKASGACIEGPNLCSRELVV